MISPLLTAKRRSNFVRLITNAATIIFGVLVVGSWLGNPSRPLVFVVGLILYLSAALVVWWLEP